MLIIELFIIVLVYGVTLKKYDYNPVAKKNQPYQRRNY